MSGASAVGLFLCKTSESKPFSNKHMDQIPTNASIYGNMSQILDLKNVNLTPDPITKNQTTRKKYDLEIFERFYSRNELLKRNENLENVVENNDTYSSCQHPEYIVFTWILCLIALATVLKLYYLVKTTMAAIMVACYISLIIEVYPYNFEKDIGSGMPLSFQMLILLVVFLIMVAYHARLVEVRLLHLEKIRHG